MTVDGGGVNQYHRRFPIEDDRQCPNERRHILVIHATIETLVDDNPDTRGDGHQERDVSPALRADDPVDRLAHRSTAPQLLRLKPVSSM